MFLPQPMKEESKPIDVSKPAGEDFTRVLEKAPGTKEPVDSSEKPVWEGPSLGITDELPKPEEKEEQPRALLVTGAFSAWVHLPIPSFS